MYGRKKYVYMVLLILLSSTFSFIVSAGDEQDPEIVDTTRDVRGVFGFLPEIFHRHIDITKAWFFEDENDPEYLFTAITVRNLEYKPLRSIYSVHWGFDGKTYASGCHIHSNGEYEGHFVGLDRTGPYYSCEGFFDEEHNTITWKFPKSLVGSPTSGDVLINTWAWTALRGVDEAKHQQFGIGEVVKDWAGYEDELYGKYYMIKY